MSVASQPSDQLGGGGGGEVQVPQKISCPMGKKV